MPTRRFFAVTASYLALTGAHAIPVQNGFGLTAPDQTLSFEDVTLPALTSISNQFLGQGVFFENAIWNPDPATYANMSGNRIGNYTPGAPARNLTITFSDVQGAVALVVVTAPGGSTTIRALLDGALVESATFATTFDDPLNFYGFTDIAFNQLNFSVVAPNGAAFLMDSLQTVVSTVPEPGTAALWLAAIGLAAATRRKLVPSAPARAA